jgi:hypothetical protein
MHEEGRNMTNIRRITAAIAGGALVAAPLTLLAASPASAVEREFMVGGADVNFGVEREDGGFKVDVDLDDARPGSRWRIILKHDGRTYFNEVRRADGDGDIEVERNRPNTQGRDVFRATVKKVGGPMKSRTIRLR